MKKGFLFVCLFIFCLLSLINFASAQGNNTNEAKPYIDPKIYEAFNESEWIRVIIRLRDNSGINISGTKEEKIELMKQRDEWFKPIIDEVLLTLNEDEFELIRKSNDGFGGSLTNKGFDKLISDSRIGAIYKDAIAESTDYENKLYIDPEIYLRFENSEWVNIFMELNNMSEADDILDNFTEDEFKLTRKSSRRIIGETTREGFDKLINDTRIKAIYFSFEVQATDSENETEILEVNNIPQEDLNFTNKIKDNLDKKLLLVSILVGFVILIIILSVIKMKRK